jgi:hypothetical protein
MSRRWWERPFRTFQTNLREIDAGLDVEAALDAIQACGADTWLLSVGGIIANHPSDLASQTVNPALAERASGDLVGDAVAAARDRGVRVLGRMDFSKVDARRAELHPEWCFVSPEGEPQVYNGYRSVCPSGQYYQREMFAVISEVLERYPLSGFFLNWMSFNEVDYSRRYWGVCRCGACRRGFAEFAPGTELPQGQEDPGYATWREYSSGVLEDLGARLSAHVRALAPDAVLVLGDRADVTFHEANNAVGRPLWHLATTEAVGAARTADPLRPVFVNGVAFVDMPYRWAGEDPHHFVQYSLQSIAHGAQPSMYIMGGPEHSPFPALEAGAEILCFHREHDALYDGLRSRARVGLVRPGPAGGEHSRAEFEGWLLALTESHVPVDVLALEHLHEVDPERFAAVVVPDAGTLGEAAVAWLGRLERDGGTVLTTGSTAWDEDRFQLGGNSFVRQRAEYTSEESLRSLHLPLDDVGGGHVPVIGAFRVLEPEPGARAGWPALGRSLYGPPEKCYGNEPTTHPGIVARRGASGGRLLVLPWLPGAVLRRLGLGAVREALIALLEDDGAVPIRLVGTLPDRVQVVVGTTGRATVVHLLNRSGDLVQRFAAPLAIAPADLELPLERAPLGVRAHVAGDDLEWAWEAGTLRLRTPEIGLFEVLEIQSDNN